MATLRDAVPADCAAALAYSRDVAPEDPALWAAALEYFTRRAPEAHWGYFAPWLSRGLSAGQPVELAIRRLLSELQPCRRSQALLTSLGNLMCEARFRNLIGWVSTRGTLWLELVRAWTEQPTCAESYDCSHNLILSLARCVIGRLPEQEQRELSLACLQALVKHHLPPAHAALFSLPEGLQQALGPESIPTLLDLLKLGAADLDPALLKSHTRKKAADPTNIPAVQLCFHGLLGFLAHPEWEIPKPARPTGINRKVLSGLIDLLYHYPRSNLSRLPGETREDYVGRLPPLGRLLAIV